MKYLKLIINEQVDIGELEYNLENKINATYFIDQGRISETIIGNKRK